MEVPLLVRVTFCIFICYYVPTIPAKTVEHNFQKESFCNVSTLPYQVVWPKTAIYCGFLCAADVKCAGYDFSFYNGCRLYDTGVYNGARCGQSVSGSLQLYMKRELCQHNGYLDNQQRCICVNGYVGDHCERFMHDCSEGADTGFYNNDTFYWIQPAMARAPFQAFCEMSNGSRVTRIQFRYSPNFSFNRTWQEYKDGFNISYKDMWLGNLKIYWITNSRPQWLVIQLFDANHTKVIYLENFKMAREEDQFAVSNTNSISPSGELNMGLCWPSSSIKFSTYDRDNDPSEDNCAALYGAGFWFDSSNCSQCNPNGDPKLSAVRLGIPNELFWTPGLGDWSPRGILMGLFVPGGGK